MRIVYFISVISLFCLNFNADSLAEYPEDKAFKNCMEKSETHTALIQCAINAEEQWDQKLNVNYRLLYNSLPLEGKQSLQASELAWLKYRDLEFKFTAGLPYPRDWSKEGNRWIEIHAGERMKIVKQRAIELEAYYQEIKENRY